MVTIAIITPLKRLENIPMIFSNLRYNALRYINVSFHWFPIFDKSEEEWFSFWKEKLDHLGKEHENFKIQPLLSTVNKAIAGHAHRNIALEEIKKQYEDVWIYNLDDDNILHDNFTKFFAINENYLTSCAGVLSSQIMRDGRLRLQADKDRVIVCHVDTAQLAFSLKNLGDDKYIENDYCADGHFINAFYEKNKERIYIEKTPLCYYNYLKMKLIHTKSIRKYKNIFEGLVEDFGYIYYSSILCYCGIIEKNRDDNFWQIWLIEKEKEVMGICGLYSLNSSSEELWLGWFGIVPSYRNKGLGTRVLLRLQKKAKRYGTKRLFVYVDKDEKAVPFYKRNGFELIGKVKDYVEYHNLSMNDFEDENDIVMVKHL